jgi:hypothetical protein
MLKEESVVGRKLGSLPVTKPPPSHIYKLRYFRHAQQRNLEVPFGNDALHSPSQAEENRAEINETSVQHLIGMGV